MRANGGALERSESVFKRQSGDLERFDKSGNSSKMTNFVQKQDTLHNSNYGSPNFLMNKQSNLECQKQGNFGEQRRARPLLLIFYIIELKIFVPRLFETLAFPIGPECCHLAR